MHRTFIFDRINYSCALGVLQLLNEIDNLKEKSDEIQYELKIKPIHKEKKQKKSIKSNKRRHEKSTEIDNIDLEELTECFLDESSSNSIIDADDTVEEGSFKEDNKNQANNEVGEKRKRIRKRRKKGEEHEEIAKHKKVEVEPVKKIPLYENPYRGLRNAPNPLDAMTDIEILKEYKISRKTIYEIMEMIKHNWRHLDNKGLPIPPLMCFLITLKYLTEGSFQKGIFPNVSQPSVSRSISHTCKALLEHKDTYISFPPAEDFDQVKLEFYQRGKFPETIGCVGCTHVGIVVRPTSKGMPNIYFSNFKNEKGYHSLRVQLIVGPHGEIYDIDPRCPGSVHENTIFNMCDVKKNMIGPTLNGVFIGGEAYNPAPYLMTSIKNAQHLGEQLYNEALNETYTVFYDTINTFKRRFKCLQKFLRCSLQTQQNLITSCAIIHNIAKLNNDYMLLEDEQRDVHEPCPPKPTRRIQKPPIEEGALQERKKFILKHFPTYQSNQTTLYFYM